VYLTAFIFGGSKLLPDTYTPNRGAVNPGFCIDLPNTAQRIVSDANPSRNLFDARVLRIAALLAAN
jgi:hypothetical protein